LTGAAFSPVEWKVRERTLSTATHTLVMGVLNVTPDSFSDGGRYSTAGGVDVAAAITAGRRIWDEGADIVDVGGESTRPGAQPVGVGIELDRTVAVVEALAAQGMVVSIDTSKPQVAAAALDAGAMIVNDVTGLRDARMVEVCGVSGAGVVVMHMQGEPTTMQVDPRYHDVVAEVRDHLAARLERSGLDPATVCLDPGIGFGKTDEHNLALLSHLDEFVALGSPVLVGTSRKGFLGRILADAVGGEASLEQRDRATAATTVFAIAAGVAVVRAHNVPMTLDVARAADAIVRAQSGEGKR
jgi:dihydropteroate synthase